MASDSPFISAASNILSGTVSDRFPCVRSGLGALTRVAQPPLLVPMDSEQLDTMCIREPGAVLPRILSIHVLFILQSLVVPSLPQQRSPSPGQQGKVVGGDLISL